jgi:hypothetical protein
MVELVRAGRTPEALAREFEPSAQAIRNWLPRPTATKAAQRRIDDAGAAGVGRLRWENRQLRLERRSCQRQPPGSPGDRFDTREVFELVKANQDCYSVSTMCRLLGVSSSGYHAWKHRAPSPRAMADAALLERIRAIHHRSRATYGIPRIHAELVDEGFRIGRKRVARLMRLAGLQGVSRCKGGRTTIRGKEMQVIPDLVNRNFRTTAPTSCGWRISSILSFDLRSIRVSRHHGRRTITQRKGHESFPHVFV